MKHQQNNDKEVSAIAFMRSFDETMNLMESIGDNTAKEQKVLQESAVHMENYTDDEGVFDMESLLDVDVSDTEENQPRMYNTPDEDLTDSDKQLIVDEFAEQLSNMHEEVIDFSDVGPIATVIQDKFGFKQNLDSFLTDLMTSAADKQDSQSFAHGKPIPGVAAEEEGGPSDIAPAQAGPTDVDAGGVDALGMEAGMTADATDIAMDQEVGLDIEPTLDEPVLDEVAPEAPVEEDVLSEEEPELEVIPAVDSEEVPEVDSEVIPAVDSEEVPAVDSEEVPEVDTEETESDEVASDEEETEEDVGEEGEEDLEAQFESIRSKHIEATEAEMLVESMLEIATESSKEESVDAQLEAIRTDLLENEYPSAQDQDAFEKSADAAESSAQKGAEDMKEEDLSEETEDITPVLEAIATQYHSGEDAKVNAAKAKLEAIETEKKLDAQLESIAGNYHNGVKAKLEADEAEAKLDEKLSTLVESYHTSAKSSDDSKANLEARKQAKAKLDELSK
jgi:hypothetical protein